MNVPALLDHLRRAFGAPALALSAPPTPLTGGYDTQIYALRLDAAPPELAGPLVLRVLRPHHDPARVLREQATQNALADLGYPAPRVRLASADPALLGAPFLLMDFARGRPLVAARPLGMGPKLVALQLRLHALDPAPLARALGAAGAFDGYLDALGQRIARAGLAGLAPLLAWLRRRQPRDDAAPVICHGDFHPQNVLVAEGATTAVLDWPNVLVADPAFDVASTLNILRFVPAGLAAVPRGLRWLARIAQPLLAARYLGAYRRERPIADARLAYYQVAAGLRALVGAAEGRRRARPDGAASALDASPYAARLLAHAREVSGVRGDLA